MKLQRGKRSIFVLIDTELDADEDELLERLLEVEEVKNVHIINGQYEILAVVEVDLRGKPIFSTIQERSLDIVREIRQIEGIRETRIGLGPPPYQG